MELSNKDLGIYLKEIRNSLGYSTYDVQKLCDISPSYLSLMENGKRKPSAIILKKIASIYNVDYIDLYIRAGFIDLALKEGLVSIETNYADVLREKYNIPEFIAPTENAFPTADLPIKIPILGKISAGLPILANENIEGYDFAPSSYIKKDFEYFYLRVSGDSMNIKFAPNDLVLVQKQECLENGEIGVILVNGFDATVKRFKQQNDLIILEPMSTNEEHQIQIYNPKDISINIVGKVVSYLGKV